MGSDSIFLSAGDGLGFAALAGSCWKGEHPGGRGSDTQCYETQYGRVMRGTIRMTQQREGATVSFEGDSVFAWNARAGLINYSQWGASGARRASGRRRSPPPTAGCGLSPPPPT